MYVHHTWCNLAEAVIYPFNKNTRKRHLSSVCPGNLCYKRCRQKATKRASDSRGSQQERRYPELWEVLLVLDSQQSTPHHFGIREFALKKEGKGPKSQPLRNTLDDIYNASVNLYSPAVTVQSRIQKKRLHALVEMCPSIHRTTSRVMDCHSSRHVLLGALSLS